VRPRAYTPRARTPSASSSEPLTTSAPVNAAFSLGAIIAADTLLHKLFITRSIRFPSSLAGSMILFGGLCTVRSVAPKLADGIFETAKPGCGFINKWLPIFFVPNLVFLPLVLKLRAAEATRLAILMLAGAVISVPVCAFAALAASGKDESSAPSIREVISSPPSAPAPRAFPTPLLGNLAALTALCGGLSAAALRGLVPLPAAPLRDAFLLGATATGFVGGSTLVPTSTQKVVHPLITCTLFTHAAAAAFGAVVGTPYRTVLRRYLLPGGGPLSAPGNLLLAMLGPATLSFGFSMYEKRKLLRESLPAVGGAVTVASFGGLFGSAAAARALGLSGTLTRACLPRQVTAPLAIAISGLVGADPGIACTIVVLTGLLVANFGRALLDAMGVKSPVARGLAMGAAGHGIGTAATAVEPAAFPFAAIAMVTNALVSTVIASNPQLRRALLSTAGLPAV
jgi:putative effector of murein hydrolase/putative effector of murein hydrolase LrgA (UPF0299 family)